MKFPRQRMEVHSMMRIFYNFCIWSIILLGVRAGRLNITLGRINAHIPVNKCCSSFGCIRPNPKNALVTTLRSDIYFPLLYGLACSLNQSNPGETLLVATVRGDLSANVELGVQKIGSFVKLIYWNEYQFANEFHSRFSLNWVKLRAWEMEEYDALLMIDADAIIVGSIKYLFTLPTHFATVLDNDKFTNSHHALGRMQGGVVLLRPCKRIATHMMTLLNHNMKLRFQQSHAEQSFLDWYFKYDRWALPMEYNAISNLLLPPLFKTLGGNDPVIIHFTENKPFTPNEQKYPSHKFASCIKSGYSLFDEIGLLDNLLSMT